MNAHSSWKYSEATFKNSTYFPHIQEPEEVLNQSFVLLDWEKENAVNF